MREKQTDDTTVTSGKAKQKAARRQTLKHQKCKIFLTKNTPIQINKNSWQQKADLALSFEKRNKLTVKETEFTLTEAAVLNRNPNIELSLCFLSELRTCYSIFALVYTN